MAFAFRQAVPLDQVQLDPSLALMGTRDAPAVQAGAPQGQAMPAQVAQQAPPQMAPQAQPANGNVPALADIPVSTGEAVMAWLAHGGTPAEAAHSVRAVKLQNIQDQIGLQQAQQRWLLAQKLDPQAQLDYLTSPQDYVKSDAKNFEPISATEGQTIMYRGGQGAPGGYSAFAPKTGVSASGVPYAFTKDGYQSIGPQQPGEKSVTPSGAVVDSHTGLTGQAVSVPNNVPLGTTPGEFIPKVIGGQGAPSGGAVPALAGVSTSGPFNPAAFIKSFILPHEGGLNPHDMNGAPSKYGINQTANPGVDVAHLTPEQATQIYMQKYLPMSGAANLPPALAAVHLDTSIINPQRAQQFLNQSGGDPSKYMDLRDAWMQHMVQNNPAAAPYAKAWGQRNADLRGIVAQSGGASPQNGSTQPGSATSPGYHPLGTAVTPRPLTDPAERTKWGIDTNDKAPYVLGPQGPERRGDNMFGPKDQLAYTAQVTSMDPYKNYGLSRGYLTTMQGLLKQPGGFSDLGIIEMAGKTVNPTVAIRPNMIEQYSKEVGWPDWLVGQISSVENHGGHLTQEGRNALLNIAQANVQSHWQQLQPILQKVDHDASRYHLTREDLIPGLVPMPGDPPAPYAGSKVPGRPVQADAAQPARLPPGIPPAAQRKPGVYTTPKGPAMWDGQSWHLQQAPH